MKDLRFRILIQYANISTDEQNQVRIITASNLRSDKQVNRGYSGFGPRFGVDLSHDLSHGFGISGNTALGLLIGTHSSTTQFSSNSPATRMLSSRAMVLEIEGKLGLFYSVTI